jgi:hypothetical protein
MEVHETPSSRWKVGCRVKVKGGGGVKTSGRSPNRGMT